MESTSVLSFLRSIEVKNPCTARGRNGYFRPRLIELEAFEIAMITEDSGPGLDIKVWSVQQGYMAPIMVELGDEDVTALHDALGLYLSHRASQKKEDEGRI